MSAPVLVFGFTHRGWPSGGPCPRLITGLTVHRDYDSLYYLDIVSVRSTTPLLLTCYIRSSGGSCLSRERVYLLGVSTTAAGYYIQTGATHILDGSLHLESVVLQWSKFVETRAQKTAATSN